MIILEENFKWHLEAFASELFIYILTFYHFIKIKNAKRCCNFTAQLHKLFSISLFYRTAV